MTIPIIGFDKSAGIRVDLDQLVSSRMLIQANSGGGKSRMLRYILEQTHGKIPQIIIDPEGEFASLREKFDYLLAGRDGDVPADPKTAKVLCRRIAELGASCVIDIYELEMQERRRFVRVFLEELVHLPRAMWRPSLLVIDEAHLFAPERGQGEAESTQAVINVCTLGRKRGISPLLATQRISKLHKDAAAELLNKLIGRTGLDVDVKRAGDELGFDKEQRQQLKFLDPGTFYAFGPAIAREVMPVRSGAITTTHPEPGKVAPPAPPPPAAIKKLVSQMQDLQKQADTEARTEAELREQLTKAQRRVRELERGNGATAPDPATIEKAIASALSRAQRDWQRESEAADKEMRTVVVAIERKVDKAAGIAEQLVAVLRNSNVPPLPERKVLATPVARIAVPAGIPVRQPAETVTTVIPTEGVTRPQQRILDALAALEAVGMDDVDRSNVAVFADVSPSSSGYDNNLGALRTAGLLAYPSRGRVSLTDAGRKIASDAGEIRSLDQLHQAWFSKLPNPQVNILRALIDHGEMDRATLADMVGVSAASSGFDNNLGRLRTLGLIDYPRRGFVDTTDLLFPDGLL